MKILITAGMSAKSFKIKNLLTDAEILLADFGVLPQMASKTLQFLSFGERNEDTLAHTILTACLDQQIEVCIPLNKEEIAASAEASALFQEFNIRLIVPNLHWLGNKGDDSQKGADILILENGTNLVDQQSYPVFEHLSGVFWFNKADASIQLYQ